MTGPRGSGEDEVSGKAAEVADEFDRHRRRVLWGLTTGLYLVGSRGDERINLMTANLVVQVSMEPKLVAVALEHESVTTQLVRASGAFSLSILARADRDVVRRFVKPVTEVEFASDGTAVSMSGHPVVEVGASRLPVLASAAGYVACRLTNVDDLGSHVLCIGEVTDVGGDPSGTEVLRMEDTRMHYGG